MGPGPRRLVAALVLAVLAALSLLRWGNALEETGAYLCLVRHWAGDWPAPIDDHMRLFANLPLGWWRLAAVFEARGVLLEALLVEVVIARFLLGASAYALAAASGARETGRFAAAALAVLGVPLTFAHFPLLHAEALPGSVALPATFFALAAALTGRSVTAGVLLGAAALVHPPHAFVSAPSVLVAALFVTPPEGRRRALLRLVGACAIVALPQVVSVLLHNTEGVSAFVVSRAQWYATERATAGGHVFFSALGRPLQGRLLGLVAVALIYLKAPEERARALAAAALAGLGVATAGLLLADAEVLPLALLKVPFGRGGLVAAMAARVLVGAEVGAALAGDHERGAGERARRLGLALAAAGVLESEVVFAAGVALLAASLLVREARLPGYAGLTLALAHAASAWGDDLARAIVLSATLVLLLELATRRPHPWGYAVAALVLSTVVHHVAWPPSVRWARVSAAPHAPGSAERVELGRFIEANLPKDALLLVPPEERTLPYFAGRNVVALASWGTYSHWDPRLGSEELARLERIGFRFGERGSETAYHAWSAARILEVARAEKATYVVLDRALGGPSLGRPLHANARFELHAVPSP